jgi:hypothetical protein
MTKQKESKKRPPEMLLFVVGIITLYLLAITIPIPFSNNSDVYIDTVVKKSVDIIIPQPLTFISVTAKVQQSTFLSVPNLGCIAGCSGLITITATTPSSSVTKTVDPIYLTTTTPVQIILRKVPPTEKLVTLTLYEDGIVTSTKEIVLP